MANETLTIPAAPRRARIDPAAERTATDYFLSTAELASVLTSRKVLEANASEISTHGGRVEAAMDSKNLGDVAEAVRRKTPRRVFLSMNGHERYRMLAKYDGFIVSRDDQSFTARFFEGGSDYPVMEADFDIEDISEDDRGLAVPGTRLVWTMSYRHEGSTVFRDSRIYLRRLEWTAEDLRAARETVAALTDGLDWERHTATRG